MKSLLLLGTGAAVGYVLGAKAGHERYDQIMALAGQTAGKAQQNMPHSVSDAADQASAKAERLTEAARAKAHDVIDVASGKVDDLADHAQDIREQTKERVEGSSESTDAPSTPKAAKKAAPSSPSSRS